MAGRKARALDRQLRDERRQLARACQHPSLIEAHLRPIEDALRIKAFKSVELNTELSLLNTGFFVPVPNIEVSAPALKTGLSIPVLSNIPRSQLLAAIRIASVNAKILFPNGLAAWLHGTPETEESAMPPQATLARIARSPLSLWVHAAVADALTGGRPDIFFDLLAQTFRVLLKEDKPSTMVSYVTAVHKATIELVREFYDSYNEKGTPRPWKVLRIPTFMPAKFEIKKKARAMFGKRVPNIHRKWDPQTGRYKSQDSLWTKIFASAGLRALIDARGQHRRKE
jgi:hypothetical protein